MVNAFDIPECFVQGSVPTYKWARGEQDKPHNGHAKCSTPARVSNEIRQTGPYVEKENTRINWNDKIVNVIIKLTYIPQNHTWQIEDKVE